MQTLIAILKLIPVIITTAQAIEAAIPLPGQGKAKLDLILGTVSEVYASCDSLRKELPLEKITALVSSITSRVVGLFNALGLFQKPATA